MRHSVITFIDWVNIFHAYTLYKRYNETTVFIYKKEYKNLLKNLNSSHKTKSFLVLNVYKRKDEIIVKKRINEPVFFRSFTYYFRERKEKETFIDLFFTLASNAYVLYIESRSRIHVNILRGLNMFRSDIYKIKTMCILRFMFM